MRKGLGVLCCLAALVGPVFGLKTFVFEEFTSTSWTYCPATAAGLHQLTGEAKDSLIVVAYHCASGDPFYTSECNSRAYNYYGIQGTPTVVYNGWGFQASPSYADSRWYFDTLKLVAPTPKVTIDLTGSTYDAGARSGTLNAHIVNTSGGSLTGVVHVLITETNISSGGSTYYDVVRDMVDGYLGTTKNLSSGGSTDISQAFSINAAWNANNCSIIIWYQKTSGKGVEICQGAKKTIASFAVEENANKVAEIMFKIMPNPVLTKANISYTLKDRSEISLNVYDASGKLIKTLANGIYGAGENKITWDRRDNNGRFVGAGTYFCKLRTGESVATKILTVI